MKSLPFWMLALLPFVGAAQTYITIPNGSFERWTPAPGPAGAMNPETWGTYNPGASNQVVPVVSRSADAVDSGWSMIMRPVRGMCPAFFGCTNLMRFYGPNPPPDTDIVVPRRFKGWYKFVRDSFVLDANLDICFQRAGPIACGKGYASLYPVPASVWTPFSLELDTPTSPAGIAAPVNGYSITIFMNTKDTSAYPVSYLQLDGLHVEYDTISTNSIVTPPARAQTSISPNPATNHTILSWQEPLPNAGIVLIQNPNGQTLRQQLVSKGVHSLELDCSSLPQGVYVVRLVAPGHAPPPVRLLIQ